MKQKMAAIIRKDLRGITANKNLFLSLLIVPLVFTVVFPSILVCAIHFMPGDPDCYAFRKHGTGYDENDAELYSSGVFFDYPCDVCLHYVSKFFCG